MKTTRPRELIAFTLAVASIVAFLAMLSRTQAGAEEAAGGEPYSGDFLTRSTLSGDWAGKRNGLAAKGITLDATVTQVEQGVGGGGKDSSC